MPLSAIIQLHHGGQCYWWMPLTCQKSLTTLSSDLTWLLTGSKVTNLAAIDTNWISRYKYNEPTTTATKVRTYTQNTATNKNVYICKYNEPTTADAKVRTYTQNTASNKNVYIYVNTMSLQPRTRKSVHTQILLLIKMYIYVNTMSLRPRTRKSVNTHTKYCY